MQRVVGSFQPHLGRGVRLFRPEEVAHNIARVLAQRRFADRMICERRTGSCHDNRTACESARQLRTKNEDASCEANDDDVNAGGNSCPKMDLKESFPHPNALWLTKQMLPGTHLRRIIPVPGGLLKVCD